tara:strand:- start:1786 stop:2088 length:303 start_codon:yes stop_codon:yes gene_type:complete
MSKPVSVVIKTSTKPEKKLMAVFSLDNGRTRTSHFGQKNAPDYTKTRDKAQRSRYLARHKARENWNDPVTSGSLSRHILWGDSTSIRTNISNYKKKFNLK